MPLGACSSMAEQAAHNRLVEGSNPSGPILTVNMKYFRFISRMWGMRCHEEFMCFSMIRALVLQALV